MGGCCFTPTKRDFLWWYWLLLVSIVGIPMLLAVMYVTVAPATDEAAKKRRGQVAAWIFWIGTVVTAVASYFVLDFVLDHVYPESSTHWWEGGEAYHDSYVFLALQFCVAFVCANLTNGFVRGKEWYGRIPSFLAGIVMYLFALAVPDLLFRRPAINVMQFMACMLPAHYWGLFKASPEQWTAWRALAAFVAGAPLFFVVSYFGEDFAAWVCGQF
jgi:hypothetical protein